MRYVKQNKFNTRSYLLCYGVEVLCTGPLLIVNAYSWIEILKGDKTLKLARTALMCSYG